MLFGYGCKVEFMFRIMRLDDVVCDFMRKGEIPGSLISGQVKVRVPTPVSQLTTK